MIYSEMSPISDRFECRLSNCAFSSRAALCANLHSCPKRPQNLSRAGDEEGETHLLLLCSALKRGTTEMAVILLHCDFP